MRVFGKIENRSELVVSGWLIDLDNSESSLTIEVSSEFIEPFDLVCDLPVKKLANTKFHKSGRCGFEIELSKFNGFSNGVLALKLLEKTYRKPIELSPIIIDRRKNRNRILLVGLNKSGTSILATRIVKGMNPSKLHFEPRGKIGLNSYLPHIDYSDRNNVVTKCLYYPGYDLNLYKISCLYDKKVWIIRDPRDVLVSMFFYKWKVESKSNRTAFDSALQKVKLKESHPSLFNFLSIVNGDTDLSYLLSVYEKTIKTLSRLDKTWFIFKYEKHINGENDELNRYLGFRISEKSSLPLKLGYVKRSASTGSWRDYFTEEDVRQLKPLLSPLLLKLEYDPRDWNLNYPDSLNPISGSEYMLSFLNN